MSGPNDSAGIERLAGKLYHKMAIKASKSTKIMRNVENNSTLKHDSMQQLSKATLQLSKMHAYHMKAMKLERARVTRD